MSIVELFHNPFTIETTLTIDGTMLTPEIPLYQKLENRRLQDWVDDLFWDLKELIGSESFTLIFKGTETDFNDLQELADRSKEKKIDLQFSGKRGNVSNRIKQLKKLYKDALSGPIEKFKDERIKQAFDQALSPDFETYVVGTMSAGKSTFINAMLGKDLLHSMAGACTARIARITDVDDMLDITGERYNKDGSVIGKQGQKITSEILKDWNEDQNTNRIEIKMNIPSINEVDNIRMVVIDTPDTNSSTNKEHAKVTQNILDGNSLSMVLYVLNAGQLTTEDDKTLLNHVRRSIESGGRRASERVVFILNRVDQLKRRYDDIDGALKIARDYLYDNRIHNTRIFCASANWCKLARMKKTEECSSDELEEFEELDGFVLKAKKYPKYHFHKYSDRYVSPWVRERIKKRLDEIGEDDLSALELYSGVPVIEEVIQEFINKHAIPAKIADAVHALQEITKEVDGEEALLHLLAKQQTDSEIALLSKKLGQLQEQLELGNKGKQYRDKLKKEKFSKPAIAKHLNSTNVKANDLIQRFQDQSQEGEEWLSVNDATISTDKLVQDAYLLGEEIVVLIKNGVQSYISETLQRLTEEYNEYLKNLLGECSFPVDLEKFTFSTFSMPPAVGIVERFKQLRTIKVGAQDEYDGSIWRPWTWFKYKKVDVCGEREMVNKREISNAIVGSLTSSILALKTAAQEESEKRYDAAKVAFINNMVKLDKIVNKGIDDLRLSLNDKSKLEKKKIELQRNIEWYDSFKLRLSNLLEV